MKRNKNKNKFKRRRNLNRNTNRYCKFTAENVDQIDYKDVETLKKYINENESNLQATTKTKTFPATIETS